MVILLFHTELNKIRLLILAKETDFVCQNDSGCQQILSNVEYNTYLEEYFLNFYIIYFSWNKGLLG